MLFGSALWLGSLARLFGSALWLGRFDSFLSIRPPLGFLILRYVLFEFFSVRIVRFLGEESFVLGHGPGFHPSPIVERAQAEVRLGFPDWIEAQCLFEEGHRFRTLLNLEIRF